MGYKMVAKKITNCFLALTYLWLVQYTFGANAESLEMEKQEFKQERARIKAFDKSLAPGPVNDLGKYEKFANEIQNKWKDKNKEDYARLMLEVCGPLGSGRFSEDHQFVVARKYALLALEDANEIPLVTELELAAHVTSDMATPRAAKGQEWAQLRNTDAKVRFHVWKRLMDAIDPNWDPNEKLVSPNFVATMMGFPGTVAPGSIKDTKLRAEYETALEANQKKNERHCEQNQLHKWLTRFPKYAEPYIIEAFSRPPFNLEELNHYLNNYIADEKTRSRILDAVTKNIEKQAKETPEDPNQQN